mgnify:CR=1 FL=1
MYIGVEGCEDEVDGVYIGVEGCEDEVDGDGEVTGDIAGEKEGVVAAICRLSGITFKPWLGC